MDVEKFNERLGRTRSEASRQNLALQTLRKEGLDSSTILMPDYKGKTISGRGITARKVDKSRCV